MELQELLENRRSIRRYKVGDVDEADIQEMVAAANMAPSAKNLQNWHFIAIKNRQIITKIGELILEKNETIAARLNDVDEEKANQFRFFCKKYTIFWKDTSPVLIAVFTTDYVPDGYEEYQLIGEDPSVLDDLKLHRNPGMQSVGCAIENLVLKAVEKGYGTTILTSPNYAAPEIERYLEKSAIFHQEGFYLASMIAMGIPQEHQNRPSKKDLSEVYTFVE